MVVLVGAVVAAIAGIAHAANTGWRALIGIPLVLALIAALAYLFTALAFAPVAIVLERKPVWASISRSFALVRNHFWRVLGIRLLAGVVAAVVAGAVSVPFSIAGQLVMFDAGTAGPFILATAITSVGRRSARSSPHRSPPVSSCCSTPTPGSAPKRSTSSCRPVQPDPRRRRDGQSVADPAAVRP